MQAFSGLYVRGVPYLYLSNLCATAIAAAVIWTPAACAAPLVSGSASNVLTEFFWEVYDDAAVDNPRPAHGKLTYVYWQEVTAAVSQQLYRVILLGPQSPIELGEISTTGFIPNTGVAPNEVTEADWRWNWPSGVVLNPGQRTASLYVNSPDPPGTITADIANCNPFLCFYPTTSIVGPTSIPSDFDHNGVVNSGDLATWEDSYGVNDLADADQDGDSDGADLLLWQQQHGIGIGSVLTSRVVPEPSNSVLLVSLVATGVLLARTIGCLSPVLCLWEVI